MNLRDQLIAISRGVGPRADVYAPILSEAMSEFDINTPDRQAHFLAQVLHESGSLFYTRELASGNAYEGRADLGNTEPGDGPRYRGRGLIQITGRANYAEIGQALGIDAISNPALLEEPKNAARSAAWFWCFGAGRRLSKRAIAYGVKPGCNLNDLADANDFMGITLAINGGTNGMQNREALLKRAHDALQKVG